MAVLFSSSMSATAITPSQANDLMSLKHLITLQLLFFAFLPMAQAETKAEAPTKKSEKEFFTPEADKRKLVDKVTIDPNLPKVLILGDSISMGYTNMVREGLKGKANVVRPKDNCGDTVIGLKKLDSWLGDKDWDVIHFNWGLWDLCYRNPQMEKAGNRDKVNGKISVPLPEYEKNLDQLVEQLKATGATLIWANTTLVPEDEMGRNVGDDTKYNEVAARVMQKHGVAINDLHKLSAAFEPEMFIKPRDVHYTPAGSQKLAEQVVAKISELLGEKK
jgi:lysophospholipase L1-like esterase